MNKTSLSLRRLTISAVLLSISLVLKTTTSFYLPLFGESGMRVGISGIFSMLPAILFGPGYGALVSGAQDLLGYLLRPTGPYLPIMTLIMALGGFLRGLFWRFLRKKDSKKMRQIVLVISLILLGIGVLNMVNLGVDGVDAQYYQATEGEVPSLDNLHLISRMVIKRTMNTKDPTGNLKIYLTTLTWGLLGAAGLGLLLLLADFLIGKRLAKGDTVAQIPQLLLALVGSGLIVTTLNTIVLRQTIYTSWQVLPFAVVWLPRAVEEVVGNTVKVYFIAALLAVMRRQPTLKQIMDKK